jgi:hypothetical protein
MNSIAKWLMISGVVLFVIGILWQLVGKYIPLGRLPGDIIFEKENMKVFFPITTMIIISVVLSFIFSLGRFFR